MIRVFNVYFPNRIVLLALSEALLIFSVLHAAFVGFGAFPDQGNELYRIALASSVCMLCMYYYDLYDSVVSSNGREVLTRLVQVLGTTSVILAVLYYAYPALGLGVNAFVLGIAWVGVSLALWRQLFFALNRSPRLSEKALLVGDGPLARSLTSEMEKHPELGVRLVGFLSNEPVAVNGLPRVGVPGELDRVLDSSQIRRVVVTMTDRRGALPVEALLRAKTQGVLIQDGAELYEAVAGKVLLDALRPSWLIFSPGFRVSRSMLAYKRTVSLVFSLVLSLLCLPLMGLIALAIWLDSGGPIIFRQERVGQGGKRFILYKFRSMRPGADGNGKPMPAQENDDRVTRVGRWLRRTRLDELPQLYNMLRGDMNFIGPRPFVPEQEEEFLAAIPFYSQRWSVKPGATGWAQIHRGYCVTLEDNREKLAYDLFYIKNLSFGLDLLILFQTVKILLLGRGGR